MKIKPEDIEAHRRAFEIEIRWLVAHLRQFQKNQIEAMLEHEGKILKPDREFMLDFGKQGFIYTLKKYVEREETEYKGQNDFMQQIKDILNPYGDDEQPV